MGYLSRIIGPVAIAAMLAPVTGQAADDVAALRAEIAALKAEYAQRVTALEARIDQLETTATVAAAAPVEPPPPAPVGTGPQFFCVQSCDLGDPGRQLRRPVAGPGRLPLRRLHAERRRDRAGRPQLQPRRVRGDVRGQRRSVFHRRADHGAVGRRRNRRRGGVCSHHVAARRILGEGRALLLRLRLPQRDPRARLGLRRPAARVPGLLWRAVRPGRRAGEVARADGPVPRVRRGNGQRR